MSTETSVALYTLLALDPKTCLEFSRLCSNPNVALGSRNNSFSKCKVIPTDENSYPWCPGWTPAQTELSPENPLVLQASRTHLETPQPSQNGDDGQPDPTLSMNASSCRLLSFVPDVSLHTHPLPNSKAGGSTPKMNLVWPGFFNCSPIKCIDLISSFDILLFLIAFLGNYWDRWLSLAYGHYQGFYP